MGPKETRRTTDDEAAELPLGPRAQVPVPLQKGAPAVAPKGATADVGVTTPAGTSWLRQKGAVASAQNNGGVVASGVTDTAMADTVKTPVESRPPGAVPGAEKRDDPVALPTTAQGNAGTVVGVGAIQGTPASLGG